MDEKLKVELQRAKMSNYILKKQNEILMGTIGALSKEKEELIQRIEMLNNQSCGCAKKIARKVKRIIRR